MQWHMVLLQFQQEVLAPHNASVGYYSDWGNGWLIELWFTLFMLICSVSFLVVGGDYSETLETLTLRRRGEMVLSNLFCFYFIDHYWDLRRNILKVSCLRCDIRGLLWCRSLPPQVLERRIMNNGLVTR